MGKQRVPKWGNPRESVIVEDGATQGATLGVDLWRSPGVLLTIGDFQTSPGRAASAPIWRTIQEIPANVSALGGTGTAGLYVITVTGSSATRALEVEAGELTAANPDGIAGNPKLGLADVVPGAGGALKLLSFDAKGRRSEEAAATTDDLAEGATNLYFTAGRADDRIAAYVATLAALPDAIDDAAAALLGVPVGGQYRNGSALMVRIT